MSTTLGHERRNWPNHTTESDGAPTEDAPGAEGPVGGYTIVLPPNGQPGQLLALNERRELIWVDPPTPASLLSGSGLLDKQIIPPLDDSHLPNLAGTYQSVTEREQPNGYVGLDANGKISPYRLPTIARGLQGEKGDPGPHGGQGERGERGATGGVGPQGVRGPQGAQGERGPAGPRAVAPDMSEYVKIGEQPMIALASDTLARDLAYFLAERGLIRLT